MKKLLFLSLLFISVLNGCGNSTTQDYDELSNKYKELESNYNALLEELESKEELKNNTDDEHDLIVTNAPSPTKSPTNTPLPTSTPTATPTPSINDVEIYFSNNKFSVTKLNEPHTVYLYMDFNGYIGNVEYEWNLDGTGDANVEPGDAEDLGSGKFRIPVRITAEGLKNGSFNLICSIKETKTKATITVDINIPVTDKESYSTEISYEMLARYPDNYKNLRIAFTGKVTQVMSADFFGEVTARMNVDKDFDQNLYFVFDEDIIDYNLLVDDEITVYGEFTGLYSYTTVLGSEITVPKLRVNIIEKKEKVLLSSSCKLEIPETPFKIYNYSWSGTEESAIKITDISYKFEDNYNGETVNLIMYFTGNKISGNETESTTIRYKIYDEEDCLIESGSLRTDELSKDEKFKNKEEYVYGLIPGTYKVKFFDDGAKATPKPTATPTPVLEIEVVEEYTYNTTWNTYHFIVVKNNSPVSVEISTETTAYSSDGKIIELEETSEMAIGSGCKALLTESFDYNENICYFDTKFKISESMFYKSVTENLSHEEALIDDGVIIKVTNNGSEDAISTQGYVLFFNGGKVVDYDWNYFTDNEFKIKSGNSISKQFDTREYFDRIEFYISGYSY